MRSGIPIAASLSFGFAAPALGEPLRSAQSDNAAAFPAQEAPAVAKTKYCSDKGEKLVRIPVSEAFQASYGEVCEPTGETILARIAACLTRGMEAVLVPDRSGVVCAMPSRGKEYLRAEEEKRAKDPKRASKPRYFPPASIEADRICGLAGTQIPDKRILQRGLVKNLVRELKETIDPRGIRIIGGVFCNGVDLAGLDIPYALILDRGIFLCSGSTECRRSPIEVRNFRTKGDFSLDDAVAYERVLIARSEIAGSLYADGAFLRQIIISDSNIKGSVHIGAAFVADRLSIENSSVAGAVDVSSSLFSQLMIVENNISGSLDLTQTQSRCSYDIRKNVIDELIAVDLGLGVKTTVPATNNSTRSLFEFTQSARDKFGKAIDNFKYEKNSCDYRNSVEPGIFALVDNHIKYSMCLRTFRWLTDAENRADDSNIYLEENVIDGATWLDIEHPPEKPPGPKKERRPESEQKFSIFNVRTGTLVLDFDVAATMLVVVNGLHFEHIYTAKGYCEAALSPRSGAPGGTSESAVAQAGPAEAKKDGKTKPAFPPDLNLPSTDQITNWINKNKFAHTQQPFAEFVTVFERAGNSEGATELKIQAATFALKSTACSLLPTALQRIIGCLHEGARAGDEAKEPAKPSFLDNAERGIEKVIFWFERLVVAALQGLLALLAEHGYKPQRIGWAVLGTLVGFWLLFRCGFKIVGYSVEGSPEKIKPVGLVFLFDRLLPAYKIREENYKIDRFYVASDKAPRERAKSVKCFGGTFQVVEADPHEHETAERWLDALKFLGLVFAIFIVAAVSRLVR